MIGVSASMIGMLRAWKPLRAYAARSDRRVTMDGSRLIIRSAVSATAQLAGGMDAQKIYGRDVCMT